MGFNRLTPGADSTFSYIVSQDTALASPFDAKAVADAVEGDEALTAYVASKVAERGLKHGSADALEVSAQALAILEADPVIRLGIVEKAQAGKVLDALYALYGAEVRIPRVQLEGLPLPALLRQAEAVAKSIRHRKYREAGEESELVFYAGVDAIRFRLHNLTPAERSEAKGRLREGEPQFSEMRNLYNVNVWILRRTMVAALGWPEFQVDPADKHISDKCLATIDEDWIIELGAFVLELAELRKAEKKV